MMNQRRDLGDYGTGMASVAQSFWHSLGLHGMWFSVKAIQGPDLHFAQQWHPTNCFLLQLMGLLYNIDYCFTKTITPCVH